MGKDILDYFHFSSSAGDSTSLRKRYDALLADVRQRRKLLEEAKRRRGEFDSTLGELLPELSALEERCEGVRGEGGSQPEKIQEQVEAMQVRITYYHGDVYVSICMYYVYCCLSHSKLNETVYGMTRQVMTDKFFQLPDLVLIAFILHMF